MKKYEDIVFEKMIHLVRNDNAEARTWLIDNDCEELVQWWDAVERVEKSFQWLIDHKYLQLAAIVDAYDENDKAKVFLLASGNRELAAFVEASLGSKKAMMWLIKYHHNGWALLAKEIYEKDKKKDSGGFFGAFFSLGNPFR